MCVKDTGTKYQLWISDFNIDGTFTRVHPFIISHTKTMTRTREDGKEEVFSACITPVRSSWLINLFSVLHFSILLLQQFVIILNIINLKHNIL